MVPSNAPVVVGLGSVQAGDTVSIEAFGATCHGPDKEMCGDDADGILSSAPCLNCGSLNGIAGTCAPRTALMGVFLSDTAPNGTTTPPPLSFTTAESRNFETLAPLLKQVFFIGDGRTDGGEAQRFVVPNGATRLYLGTMDNCGWWNNEGEIAVNVSLQESCGADLNNDATVNGADISVLLGYWGQSGNGVVGDITGDGIVNGADLAQLLGSWGPCQ